MLTQELIKILNVNGAGIPGFLTKNRFSGNFLFMFFLCLWEIIAKKRNLLFGNCNSFENTALCHEISPHLSSIFQLKHSTGVRNDVNKVPCTHKTYLQAGFSLRRKGLQVIQLRLSVFARSSPLFFLSGRPVRMASAGNLNSILQLVSRRPPHPPWADEG